MVRITLFLMWGDRSATREVAVVSAVNARGDIVRWAVFGDGRFGVWSLKSYLDKGDIPRVDEKTGWNLMLRVDFLNVI